MNYCKRFFLILIAIIVTLTGAPLAYANEDFYSSNNILFYNNQFTCTVAPTSSGIISGNSNPVKIFNYLLSRGLSEHAAAGVLGNIVVESGHTFSPFIQEFSQTWPRGGYGLVQWTGGRRTALVETITQQLPQYFSYYDAKYGGTTKESNGYIPDGIPVEVNDAFLQLELDYLYQEASVRPLRSGVGLAGGPTEWDALKSASTIREASDIWLLSFERPKHQGEAQRVTRAKSGEEWLSKVKSSGGVSTTPSENTELNVATRIDQSSTSGCLPSTLTNYNGSVKDLQQLTLRYAHEKYMPGNTTKKPAYEEAIQKAKADGQYTGDTCHGGGVDCGGFVTRLIIDSGWDPNYNYGGKIANGAGNTDNQKKWLDSNWDKIGSGNMDTSKLQPGDVAIILQGEGSSYGHVFVFVGNIEGFEKQVASASQCKRAPMAGPDLPTTMNYSWYRKKGASV